MNVDHFLDTNILIYAYSNTEPEKREQAHHLLETSSGWISTQVVNEFINVLHRKFHQPYSAINLALEQITAAVDIKVGVDLFLRRKMPMIPIG